MQSSDEFDISEMLPSVFSILGNVLYYLAMYNMVVVPLWNLMISMYKKVTKYFGPAPQLLKVMGDEYKNEEIVSIDCEMVDVFSHGRYEKKLATVAIWSAASGKIYYEKVYHKEGSFSASKWFSDTFGISKDSLEEGKPANIVKKEVAEILANKFIVVVDGKHDFKALQLDSSKYNVFDLQDIYYTVQGKQKQPHSLLSMFYHYFGAVLYPPNEKALYDARATMMVFKEYQREYSLNVYENGRNDIERLNRNVVDDLGSQLLPKKELETSESQSDGSMDDDDKSEIMLTKANPIKRVLESYHKS